MSHRVPTELRRWPLRVPAGLLQTRQRHTASRGLDIRLDLSSENLVVPRYHKFKSASLNTIHSPESGPPTTPTAPTCSRTKPSLYPRLANLIDQVGRLEHSFETIIETFDEHIDELVSRRPLVYKAFGVVHKYTGRMADIRSRVTQPSGSSPTLQESETSSSAAIVRGKRRLIREEQERVDYCLAVIAKHPHGITAAKKILDRLLDEGIVPSQENLTAVLKGMIKRREEQAEQKSDNLGEAIKLSRVLLERVPFADAHLFTLIGTLQIVSGSPTTQIIKMVADFMQVDGRSEVMEWIPQAFDLVMRAYRRDGDVKRVMSWYSMYRKSREHQSVMEGSVGPVVRKVRRQDVEARIWPHVTMLHANQEARSVGRTRTAGIYVPDRSHAGSIVRSILHDGLHIPSEVFAHLIRTATKSRDVRLASRLWEMARQRSEETGQVLKLDVWTAGFELSAKGAEGGLKDPRTMLKDMLDAHPGRVFAIHASSPMVRGLAVSIVQAALTPARGDFALALWAVQECERSHVSVDPGMIDAVARAVLTFSIARGRSPEWIRVVLGSKGLRRKRASRMGLRRHVVKRAGLMLMDWNIVSWRLFELSREMASRANVPVMERMVYLPATRPLARLETTLTPADSKLQEIRTQLYDYRWWLETTGAEAYRRNSSAMVSAVTELLRRGVLAKTLVEKTRRPQARLNANVDAEMDLLVRSIE